MVNVESSLDRRRHILLELGFATTRVGDELHGSGVITPEMHVPGTARLRTSVLVIWADTICGLLASLVMHPRVPVTLELDVDLYRPAPGAGEVRAVGRTIKAGRSVFVAEVEFTVDGAPLAYSAASFMASPNPDVELPGRLSIDMPPTGAQLTMPLAERARCERRDPGVAVLRRGVHPVPGPGPDPELPGPALPPGGPGRSRHRHRHTRLRPGPRGTARLRQQQPDHHPGHRSDLRPNRAVIPSRPRPGSAGPA